MDKWLTKCIRNFFNNDIVIGVVFVATAMYAGLVGSTIVDLPETLANLLSHPLTKISVYALIIFLSTQNFILAIFVAVAFFLTMSLIEEQRIEKFINSGGIEGFQSGSGSGNKRSTELNVKSSELASMLSGLKDKIYSDTHRCITESVGNSLNAFANKVDGRLISNGAGIGESEENKNGNENGGGELELADTEEAFTGYYGWN